MNLSKSLKKLVVRGFGITIDDLGRLMDLSTFGGLTNAGVTVNERVAQEQAVNASIVNLISQDIAKLPLNLFEFDGKTRRVAIEQQVHQLIKVAPNSIMTAFVFRQTMMSHALTWGNSYAWKVLDGVGRPLELWPLDPSRMQVAFNEKTRQRSYLYRNLDGQAVPFRQEDIFHFHGLGFDGVVGYSPIQVALRQSLGQAIAVERYGAEFFESPIPFMVLKHPSRFAGDAERDTFWKNWNEGIKSKKRFGLLEDDLSIDPTPVQRMPNEAAQFLGTLRWLKETQAMYYRVPRHKLQDLEQRAQTSVEQQNIEYVTDCLDPWATNYEQSISLFLLTPKQRERFFPKHNFRKLLRGDAKAESEYLRTLIQNGLLKPNEARAWLELDPLGPEGDKTYMQLNMAPLDILPEILKSKTPPPVARTNGEAALAHYIGGANGATEPQRTA